ncbi:hypothetical protein [Maricaulis sp.]|uniref:hypothetical protein n=1 Tax=Maricaulis sp. TaxID=1486257 RepID=UPI003A906146
MRFLPLARLLLARPFLVCLLAAAGSVAHAQDAVIAAETDRYLSCLERVETDQDAAFEDALAWRMEGGGWPAAHCEARAIIALGDGARGAAMLDQLAMAEVSDQDLPARITMLVEAGQTWLSRDEAEAGQASFAAALELDPLDGAALLGRAEASVALGEWDAADAAATAVIDQTPGLVDGWRLRAQARLETGALDAAWQDMETGREIEPANIDLLVLRGRINEARRLAALEN